LYEKDILLRNCAILRDRLAAIVDKRTSEKKPKDQIQRVHGSTDFMIWIASEENAVELVELIKDGAVGIDDLENLISAHSIIDCAIKSR